jgi:hypothetical protein
LDRGPYPTQLPRLQREVGPSVQRFDHVVRFQTFGHIHPEEFSVTRSLSSNKPIGVEFIAGNAGTFDFMDPSLRLYQMDLKSHVPREFSVYRTDIEASN